MLHEFVAAVGIKLGPIGTPKFFENPSLRFFACLVPARAKVWGETFCYSYYNTCDTAGAESCDGVRHRAAALAK